MGTFEHTVSTSPVPSASCSRYRVLWDARTKDTEDTCPRSHRVCSQRIEPECGPGLCGP